ncbi:MAG: putative toxin-antitoxin system toxin component, PIN family [Syntrophobacteraceae bacterium]|nr:putative toxin-antitoxin system toxin component, PIN family [Syntrophobacteraceae bacterium]
MRVVVDTNVFISAALKDNSLPALAVYIVERRGILLKSTATEQQLFDVLARPYFAPLVSPATYNWIKKILAAAENVIVMDRIAVCRDPTDDKFLELAVNGHADYIVTGDTDLLVLNPFRDILIVPPATFVRGTAH